MDTTDDLALFDNVISGVSSEEKSPATSEPTTPEPARDDNGRFASTEQTPAPQATNEQQVQATPAITPPEGVPVAAVQDERRKRQEAERRADELERRLAALEAKPTQAQQPIAPQTPATIWDDPDAFLQSQLSPVQQEIAQVREMILQGQAEQRHGADKLQAAKAAMEAITDEGAKRSLASEVFAGGNPFDNLVKWHERQQTLATVGNDPQAWLQSEIDKKLADPEFLAQALERARSVANPVVGRATPAPLVNLPPSLSRIPSGGGPAPQTAQSDGDLFTEITSARRGK